MRAFYLISSVLLPFTVMANPLEKFEIGIKDVNYRALVSHFPAKPANALWSEYWPMILQGGSVLQVMVRNEKPAVVRAAFEKKFLYTANGPVEGWIENPEDLNKSKPLPAMHGPDKKAFSKGWKIGVLIAKPYKETGDFI